ncbi:MAG TPA: hypothetical protein VIT43_12830 [Candidatus Dormibacteraeota bacterium]
MSQEDAHPVEVIGLHPVPGYDDAYMLEVTVQRAPASFDVGLFTQEDPNQPHSSWQVAYDERYLSPEGTTVLSWTPPQEHGDFTRLVFFMHFLDLDGPLFTPYGPVELPAATPAPPRLLAIAPYQPPD